MTNPASTTAARPLESSSSAVVRPDPATEASVVESVVPPLYLTSADTFSESTPNYSTIGADQSYFCSAASDDISSSIPTSATPPVDPASASTTDSSSEETSSETASAEATEADTAAADGGSSGGEDASSEEAGSEEDGTEEASAEGAGGEAGEEATGEDAVCHADGDESAAEADHSTDANPPAVARHGGDEDEKGIEAIVTKLPRMAPIRTPWVGSPPPQAIQRRAEIIKRTGSPPELHHAQVRQAAEHVAQAARDAQRRMVWQLGNIARDTRISIEEMAKEVQKATGAAVAHINQAIETAIGDVGMVAEDEAAHIQAQGVLTGEALEQSRNETTTQIMADLAQGSADIQALNAVSEGRFDNYLGQAEAKVFAIPDTGVVGRIPPPPAPPAPPSTRHFPVPAPDPIPQEGDRIADYQLISHAHEALASFVDTKSHLAAAAYGGDNPNAANYFSIRSNSVLDGMCTAKHTEMVQSAQQAAEQMSNASARAQFHIMLLGLTTPMSDYHERDRSGVVDANERAIRATMTETQYAVHQATMTIYEKRDQAAEYLDRDLREDLTDNIYKMGRKAYKGLMEQAASAEVTLESSAAPMAEGYRDLVTRLDALLPQGQFLDARNLLPKLILARDNAESMRKQHVEMGEQQAANTVEQMQKVKKDQVESITKAGNESATSVHNVVIQTGFDMALFGQQMTGSMSERGIAGMSAAQGYAAHNAKAIMDSIHGTEGPGLTRIDQAVVGFFNGRISGAEQGQFAGLAAFVQQMEDDTNGPLVPPITTASKDLHDRTTTLDNKMPSRDMGTVAALGGATLLCPLGGAVALGVYLYHTDADESAVITALGNLMWPGILGLEEVFRAEKHDGLRDRIRDRLNATEARQALQLFSTSAATRGAARLEIANGSTAWFTGVNREARESALQGMSSEERGLNLDAVASTRTFLEGELSGTQEELSLAYLDGNRDAAAAARTHEAMENARKEGEWGWIFSAEGARERSDSARVEAMGRMDEVIRSELAVETAYLEPSVINAHHDAFFQSFASYVDPNHRSFNAADSRDVVREYATRSYNSAVIGFSPLGLLMPAAGITVHMERVETGADASRYINDVIDHGASSNEARDSRGVFEMHRAESETSGILGTLGLSGISNTTQGRLTDAFEDRELSNLERRLAAATTTEERSRLTRELETARTHHRERLQAMAIRLGAPADISPAAAEAFMSRRMGAAFATTNTLSQAIGLSGSPSHARYGTEMIEHGRASLDAGVALASDGWGTNDDMLRRSYTDRTHAEIAGANARWSREHGGEDMTEMLGIHTASATTPVGAGSWFSNFGAETSGDLAQELQVLALGNPENDADRVTIASLRYRQQHDAGTGFITDRSMRGTDEARYMDASHTRMATTILNAAIAHDPSLRERFGDNPNAIFNPDGSLNSAIQAAAFDDRGHFRGNSSELQFAGDNMGYAADAFRAEVDRQEAMVMSGITTLALIVSLVLLVVPGVDIVAAGIITAILTGAATIAAKAGMRGGRYGWEEAATDVAQAAIEAAAAGAGGAISRGMEEGVTAATKLGRLASFGRTLSTRFGRFGGAIIREAIVGAASTAAQTAMQDDIWNDGLGRGLQRVANGAIRGAAVSAATTAASEAVSHLITRPRVDVNGVEKANLATLMENRVGAHAAEVIREGITNTVGTLAGEAVGVAIDYGQGNFHGTFGEALKQIGLAGLRELITSSIRGHIMTSNKTHFEHLMEAAQRGGTLSDAELHALRAYGISAGVFHHGDDITHVRGAVLEGRKQLNSPLLAQLPPNLREHVTHLDHESLGHLVSMLEKGGNPLAHPENLAFIHGLTAQIPGVSGDTLAQEFGNVMASRRAGAASELDSAHQSQLREHLGAGLHDELRAALGDIAVEGMQHLSPEHLAQAAEMIASGKFNFDAADNLLRAAKAQNPDLDEFSFLHNLHAAVTTSQRAQDTILRTALERRRSLVAMVPEEAAKVFAKLGDMEVLTAQRLINSGSGGTPQERDALFHAALAKNPKLTREEFHGFMEAAATRVRERVETERQTRRTQREERMTHVPEELRSTLSALPEAALVELRLRQMQGSLSPDDTVRLLNMAQRETPGVDLHALEAALHEAVKNAPTHVMSDAQSAEARQHLLSGIPADQRNQIEHTPILVLSSDEFNALTRSQKGQAVTLIINGEPVVVLREGANPRALREEGIHALQARDKNWAAHIGALDEHTLAQWDSLPLEQQIALYRNKLALELDAQTRLIHSLESDIENARTPAERQALQQHLEQVQRAHENLSRRQSEVGGISDLDIHNMRAGLTERPQWLEQPARLFNKDEPTPVLDEVELNKRRQAVEQILSPAHITHLNTLEPAQRRAILDSLAHMAAQGVDIHAHVRHLNATDFASLINALPLLVRLAPELRNPVELLKIIHFMAHLDANLPAGTKARIMAEIHGADLPQLRSLLPRAEIIVELAKVTRGNNAATGEQAQLFIQGLKRVAGLPMADLHVHTTSLVDAVDVVHWIGENLGNMDAKGVAALHRALTTLAVEGTDMSHLKSLLSDWRKALKANNPEAMVLRQHFETELQKIVAMTVKQGQSTHQLAEFFAQFPRLKDFVSGSGVERLRQLMEIAVMRVIGEGSGWLELRGLHTTLLKNNPGMQMLLAFAGGVIATVARGKLSTTNFARALQRAVNRHLFLGFDISGQENETLRGRLKRVVMMASVVAEHNLTKLNQVFSSADIHSRVTADVEANPMARQHLENLAKEAGIEIPRTRQVGDQTEEIPAAERHRMLLDQLQKKVTEAQTHLNSLAVGADHGPALQALLAAVGRVNRFNSTMIESLQRLDLLPHPRSTGNPEAIQFIGLTMHAGEQVARSVEGNTSVLGRLMDDVELAIQSGTNRIGHGVILGLGFDAHNVTKTMEMLGFTRVVADPAKGETFTGWVRGGERYSDADMHALETRRKQALERIVRQGITLEVPPTSNIILNNLGLESHPVLKMMTDVTPPPVLRISVATDNPGIHSINAHSELALLISMGVSWPQAVRVVMEGFASRMGVRPIGDSGATDVRERMVRNIREATPLSEASSVLHELALRFPEVVKDGPIPATIANQAEFEHWLRRFVIASMGSVKTNPPTTEQ